MTNEERDLIANFIARAGGAQAPAGGTAGTVAPLPPVDREADALIADLFNRYPEARYRITQMAFVQEHALVEAQNRIARLQWELQNAHAQAAPPPQAASPWGAAAQPQPQPSRGIFSGLFGGGQSAPPQQQPQYAPPPPQYGAPPPQYPPNYNPGMFQQQGPGFFGSALRTAAGVAGGVLAANALTSLFSGNHGGFGGGFGGGYGGGFGGGMGGGFGGPVIQETNIYEQAPSSPWGGPDRGADPYDQGGAPKDAPSGGWTDAAATDQGGWEPAPSQDNTDSGGGWTDASDSSDSGGGWGNDDSA